MDPSTNVVDNANAASSKNTADGKGGLKRSVADILTRFLRWRPSLTDLQDRNIIKGNIDTTKSALERGQAKQKLANLFGQYDTDTIKKQTVTCPQFGIDPTVLADMYPDQPFGIPRVLSSCFAYLEKNLHFEGLFRVTGSHIQITTLRISVENGNYDGISKCLAPQTITGMVSLFLRQLPQPLIPYALFKDCMEIGAMNEPEKIDALRQLMQEKLPEANYRIMIAFLRLLKKIAQNSAANMMTASNLGLVWGPTLLQDEDPMSSMVGDNLTRSNLLVELMIAQYDTIFPHDPKQFPTSPPNSPPPQRPPPPTIAPTSPIIARKVPTRALSQSSDALGSEPPALSSPSSPRLTASNSAIPNTLPPTIATPSRPPMAGRSRPYATVGVMSPLTSEPSSFSSPQSTLPPVPPPMPPPHRITPPPRPPHRATLLPYKDSPHHKKLPLRANSKPPSVAPPPALTTAPVSVAPSSPPLLSSPTSSPSPLAFFLSSPAPTAPLSPVGRPPRPPRVNTVANFNSPEFSTTRTRGATDGGGFGRSGPHTQLPTTENRDIYADTDIESDANGTELSTSPIRYTTRTIGVSKPAPQVKFAPSPKVPPSKPARPPPPAPHGERARAESSA